MVPYGCYGRIGAEYTFFDEQWRLLRVGAEYVLRSISRATSFLMLPQRRFLKLAHKAARKQRKVPCLQCRVPIDSEMLTIHCDVCRPEPGSLPVVVVPIPAPPAPPAKLQLELF